LLDSNDLSLRSQRKSLYLQLQPADALIVAAAILSHALERGWQIAPDFLALIQRAQVPPTNQQHAE
jgi:hypothetical protein